MQDPSRTAASTPGRNTAEAALLASAFVLAGLVLWRAALPDTPAHAGTTAQAGQYALLTTQADNSEVLALIDNATEQILVYSVEPGNRFELRARESLPAMFGAARGRATGRP